MFSGVASYVYTRRCGRGRVAAKSACELARATRGVGYLSAATARASLRAHAHTHARAPASQTCCRKATRARTHSHTLAAPACLPAATRASAQLHSRLCCLSGPGQMSIPVAQPMQPTVLPEEARGGGGSDFGGRQTPVVAVPCFSCGHVAPTPTQVPQCVNLRVKARAV